MRYVLVLAGALGLGPAARADEVDDAMARRLSGLVRDFRLPTAARVEAARTLYKLGARASAAVPDLVAVLARLRGNEQEPLQEAIVEALGQIGAASKVALPTLAQSTHRTLDVDQAVKVATDLILNASDSQEIGVLGQQLSSRDASIRLRAAKALADLGPTARAALPALNAALADPDGDVRRTVIGALRRIDPNGRPSDDLVRAIATDLVDPDPGIRLLAARALARLGPFAAVAAQDLALVRSDPDPDVRRAVTEALFRVSLPPPQP
ncbi:HEAT repeat domain-containing protein [Frigoriglobus tundricola]|uniref:HEAT repeat domain-containing protein n=1 Tax=Frigoriglobus tundricola TaxID=2774151 RepID=A0A6M5YM42_9BACT|nr:HEAT repeat domain-containing protein [Frigoriglobus tundricola]QJW94373.1 hypothetical protein FTUN_1893 [Frigoriglobus tundricola]